MQDVFTRLKLGETLSANDSGYIELNKEVEKTRRLVDEMNSSHQTQESLTSYLRQITGTDVDESVQIFLPFYIAYGKNTRLGKNVIINFNCTFLDLGGITVEGIPTNIKMNEDRRGNISFTMNVNGAAVSAGRTNNYNLPEAPRPQS